MFDFPNAPAVNQTYQGYTWDGEKWFGAGGSPAPAPVISTQRGYIFGLNMSIPAQPTITVAPGMAADSTGTAMMILAAALTKTTAAWAPGNNAGGLDTGVMTAAAWYHWFLIYNPTTLAVDVVFSGTATPDAGPTVMPSGFTKYRRIFSARFTGSSQWYGVSQVGDSFIYAFTVQDVTNQAINAGVRNLYVLTVPLGIIVDALLRATIAGVANNLALVTSPSENDQAVAGTSTGATLRTTAAPDAGSTPVVVRTDTQGRVGFRTSGGGTMYVSTYGYIDRRGKDQ